MKAVLKYYVHKLEYKDYENLPLLYPNDYGILTGIKNYDDYESQIFGDLEIIDEIVESDEKVKSDKLENVKLPSYQL